MQLLQKGNNFCVVLKFYMHFKTTERTGVAKLYLHQVYMNMTADWLYPSKSFPKVVQIALTINICKLVFSFSNM